MCVRGTDGAAVATVSLALAGQPRDDSQQRKDQHQLQRAGVFEDMVGLLHGQVIDTTLIGDGQKQR